MDKQANQIGRGLKSTVGAIYGYNTVCLESDPFLELISEEKFNGKITTIKGVYQTTRELFHNSFDILFKGSRKKAMPLWKRTFKKKKKNRRRISDCH